MKMASLITKAFVLIYVHYWNKGTSRLINQHRVLSQNKKKEFLEIVVLISIREKFYETKRYVTAESDINYLMNKNMNQWYIYMRFII